MVVCKFFQQGSCRYGQNCRFDHIYGSKYSYHASSEAPSASSYVTDDQLVNQVHTYVQSILHGGQWLLSSYVPFKEKPAFPGLVDLSPEEARLFIYEAKANNNLDQAVLFMNTQFQEARQKHELLLSKNPIIIKVLRSIYNGENVAPPFGNLTQPNSFGSNNAASVFQSAAQQSQPSIFSQSNPSNIQGFGQSNAFGAEAAKSIFAQASQNIFQNQSVNQSPSIFGGTQNVSTQPSIFAQAQPIQPPSAQSIFAQATQNVFAPSATPPPNIFQNQNTNTSASSIFASASQSLPQQNSFNQPSISSNVFTNPPSSGFGTSSQPQIDSGIYSKVEDISPEDLEAFHSEDFKMGFVPEMAPPQSLCF